MDATIAAKLLQPVPSHFLREKPIGGGKNALYVPADILFQQANNVFGVARWSSRVLKLETDFCIQDENRKWTAACTAIVRVTLMSEDGRPLCFHDDVGSGAAHRMPQLERAMDTAKKFAVTDARKRCLRLFGPAVGGGMGGMDGQAAARAAMKSSVKPPVPFPQPPVAAKPTPAVAPARPATAPLPSHVASAAAPAPVVAAASADLVLDEFQDYELQDAIYAAAALDGGDTTRYLTSTLLATRPPGPSAVVEAQPQLGASVLEGVMVAVDDGPRADMFEDDFMTSQQMRALDAVAAAAAVPAVGPASADDGSRKRPRMEGPTPAGRAPIYDTVDSTPGGLRHTPPLQAAASMPSSSGSAAKQPLMAQRGGTGAVMAGKAAQASSAAAVATASMVAGHGRGAGPIAAGPPGSRKT